MTLRRLAAALRRRLAGEEGSAVVEFLGVTLVLLVPLVYLVLVLGRVEAAAFADEGAARDAARAYVVADEEEADAHSEAPPCPWRSLARASAPSPPAPCACCAPATRAWSRARTATVTVRVPLPFVPPLVRDVVPPRGSGERHPDGRRRRVPGGAVNLRASLVRRASLDDEGQVMLLTLAFVVALLLVAVVASVAAVHLERKRVLALADLVALDAADALTERAYFERGVGAEGDGAAVPLSDAAVRRAVDDYLERHPEQRSGRRSLRVRDASSPDGRSARAELVVVTNPGPGGCLLSWWGDGVELRAESVARAS